jgi:hypothetical protein
MWAMQEHKEVAFCDFCGLRPQKSRSQREAQLVFLSDLADFATVVFLKLGHGSGCNFSAAAAYENCS